MLQDTDDIRRWGHVEVELKPGDKHWHGAQKDSWFSHLSLGGPGEDTSNEWLEEVNDECYNDL